MNLLKRVIVAVIFIPVLLWVFYHGQWPLLVFLGVISLLGAHELKAMFARRGAVLSPLIYPVTLAVFCSAGMPYWQSMPVVLAGALLLLTLPTVLRRDPSGTLNRLGGAGFIMIYVGVLPGLLYHLSELPNGRFLLLFQLIAIWIADSMAYFVGVFLGKHPGIFPISPKKTVEGTIAAVVSAGLAGWLGVVCFPSIFTIADAIAVAVGAGIIGPLGDLLESACKRDADVKDSSNLIPGHGGILDRFDSLLLAGAWLTVIQSSGLS